MGVFLEYSKEQKNALTQLRKALNKCKRLKLGCHNCYSDLKFYPTDEIVFADDVETDETTPERDIIFEEVQCPSPEWTDDPHFFQLTEKGRKKYFEQDDDASDAPPAARAASGGKVCQTKAK